MQLYQHIDRLPALLAAANLRQAQVYEAQAATETQAAPQTQRQPTAPLVVGVDLGGTQTRAAVVRGHEIVSRVSHPTPAQEGPAAVIAGIAAAIHEALEMAEAGVGDIAGIGVSAPGPLDSKTGVVFEAPNLAGWQDVPLSADLAQHFDNAVPVYLGHDANLAGLAEFRFGAGRGTHDMVYMTVSTGIGGGIIIADSIVEGASGTAGEIGHTYIDLRPDAPRDGVGHIGCLEALASGTAIARDASALITAGQGQGIRAVHDELARDEGEMQHQSAETAHAGPHVVTARDVAAAAERGDAEAIDLMHKAGFFIGIGCTNLIHTLNPEVIVIGGSVTKAGPLLFEPIMQTVLARAFQRPAEATRIVPAQLGDDGGLLGAAAYVDYRQARGE
jgi:glucokinase